MTSSKLNRKCDIRCATDPPSKAGSHPEVVVDLARNKVPLWAQGTIVNWRFHDESFERYGDAQRMKHRVARLMQEAINAWGSVAPVQFEQSVDAWDFEIYMRQRRDCQNDGCVLASAFFPSSRRERMVLYPSLLEYDEAEQLSTLVHEIGHIFGLSHFFAQTDAGEREFPSLVFGKHSRLTIMNYGSDSRLTEADRRDLARLYDAAWSADPEAEIGKKVHLLKARHAAKQ
jgi:hypothetical protein